MNAGLQRITKRGKKAFLSEQCKETEENNRMGKTRGLFKRIRNTKGTFHTNMGTIKDRNDMDITETEDIKKRCQEYTEEIYKKDLAAAAAKSLQSCPTLCDPRDDSPPGSPVPGILQARTLEWVAISFSNACK